MDDGLAQRLRDVRLLLIAEPSKSLNILTAQLRDWGLDTSTAVSATEGLCVWIEIFARSEGRIIVFADNELADHGEAWLAGRVREADPARRSGLVLVHALTRHPLEDDRRVFDHVMSKPLRGDTLRRLLLDMCAPGSHDGETPPVTDLRQRHLLVVDDNEVNRQVAEQLSMKMGITVSAVSNGLEALERLQSMRYDAVVMDCQMPVMDGYEATRRIRQQSDGVLDPRVPIIGLTGHALSGGRERCLDAGMDAYMTKPIDFIELGETIRLVLTMSRRRVPESQPTQR